MLRRLLRPSHALVTGAGVTALITVALTGCTSSAPVPAETTASAPATATVTPGPTPTSSPSFDARAATPQALSEFDSVVQKLLKSNPKPNGRAVIDALVAAGFDKKAMQLTPDTTTIGRGVDSVEFSVLWQKRDCLVGSIGASGFGSSSSRVLSTGACLIGTTRTIDW